jgi:hypothetical protein
VLFRSRSDPESLEYSDLMRLAKSIKDLASGSKLGVETEAKIREQARKEALEKAAEAAHGVADQAGLSPEQWGLIRAKILGVEVDPS